jgi:hypothetical protein
LIVHEHAWERAWTSQRHGYLERRAVIDPAAPPSVESCLADWKADHAGLHGYEEMRAELDQRFMERFFAWTPYLYAELGGAQVEREERDLLEAGKIRATEATASSAAGSWQGPTAAAPRR